MLGPNGAGKTTPLKVLLGLQHLSSGTAEIDGRPPERGSPQVGYIPQQRGFDRDLPTRGRDLVRYGLDGHRLGIHIRDLSPVHRRDVRRRVDEAIAAVGAAGYADAPIGELSGGEQQRLRVAQALVGDPKVLLCDEPLLSLDLAHQQAVTSLIDRRRRDAGTPVVFVTHEINPVLDVVDRVLYLVHGRWAVGTPGEVLTAEKLSDLYGTQVEVLRLGGRIVVVSAHEGHDVEPAGHHHHHHVQSSRDEVAS